VIEPQIILGPHEALLDGPAQAGGAGEIRQVRSRASEGEVIRNFVRFP
jgi:hypothetical protein